MWGCGGQRCPIAGVEDEYRRGKGEVTCPGWYPPVQRRKRVLTIGEDWVFLVPAFGLASLTTNQPKDHPNEQDLLRQRVICRDIRLDPLYVVILILALEMGMRPKINKPTLRDQSCKSVVGRRNLSLRPPTLPVALASYSRWASGRPLNPWLDSSNSSYNRLRPPVNPISPAAHTPIIQLLLQN